MMPRNNYPGHVLNTQVSTYHNLKIQKHKPADVYMPPIPSYGGPMAAELCFLAPTLIQNNGSGY